MYRLQRLLIIKWRVSFMCMFHQSPNINVLDGIGLGSSCAMIPFSSHAYFHSSKTECVLLMFQSVVVYGH